MISPESRVRSKELLLMPKVLNFAPLSNVNDVLSDGKTRVIFSVRSRAYANVRGIANNEAETPNEIKRFRFMYKTALNE